MAHFKEATFEIISGNESLPIYDDPDGTTEEDSEEIQKYVEAVTGATFEVKVTLDQSFYWDKCDAVRVSIDFDGNPGVYRDIDRNAVLVTKTEGSSARLVGMLRYHPESDQWTRGKYSFGALDVTDSNGAKLSPQELKDLGKFRVRYQRIYYGKVSSRSSKADKAARYSNVVDSVPSGPAAANVEKIPLPGPLGEEVTMNFLYRSRNTLQMIGCIPSTSPESSSTPDATNPPKDVTDELKKLRARLAELENTHVKSERRGATSTLKRERENQENTSQRKRRRQPGPVETVDLTGD
ncbi:MAG: hypothetical protein Q9212_000162 [Teloschistes hypoglaucus]